MQRHSRQALAETNQAFLNSFPSVWHTLRDDASALDLPTIRAWSMIMRGLVAEYLQLGDAIVESRRLKRRDELASFPNFRLSMGSKTDVPRSRTYAT